MTSVEVAAKRPETRWRRPGSVLLISCYELGHQPLSVAFPLAFLEHAGYRPSALDIAVQPLDAERARRARFVGISVPMHTALRLGVRAAERVREINPTCHIAFYGLYAHLNAEYLLQHLADSVIAGEFESVLVALVQDLEAGKAGHVEGVAQRARPAGPVLRRLPFVLPSRTGLPPLTQYAHIERDGRRDLSGYVEASRGCLHHCLHCPIPPVYGGRFFVVPKEIVREDIRRLVQAGATHITFGDPDFLNGPRHSLAVIRALHAEFPAVTFDFTAKVEHILERRALFPELGRLGCAFMVTAAESMSDTVLANLEKGHTRADIHEALRIVRDAGIAFRPTWVAFTPWTTLADYFDMLDFVEAEGLIDHVDPVQYSIRLLVPPGSALVESRAMIPYLGRLTPEAFSYEWAHPDPRMDELHRTIATTLQRAAEEEEDPAVTFYEVRKLAEAAVGKAPTAMPAVPATRRARPPRLTEPWFC
ncbi:MAG: radical SAM protein [Gemmatimonadetes bacterium]|nr:MAG: radical SAM protein [Gemmatimonadota bacterium]